MSLYRFFRPNLVSRLNVQPRVSVSPSLFQRSRYATRQRPAPPPPPGQTRTIHIHPLPLALMGFAVVCLGVGLYNHFTSDVQKYPATIRQSLRKALYYQQDKDLNLALKYFDEALTQALESPELEKNGAPLTGIMIQLGTLQERMGKLADARRTLTLALRHLLGLENDASKKLPSEAVFEVDLNSLPSIEQRKAVGIAQKLGDITSAMKMDQEAEKWYTWSVEHLLTVSSKPVSEYDDTNQVIFDAEHMPSWLTKTDIGAALEALGAFYASRNKPSLAIHLYMRALTLSGLHSCQSAVLMNNLAEAYASMGQYEEAKVWGQKGLDIAQNPNTKKLEKDGKLCDYTCGVLLFNMGMLFEQTKDKAKAIHFYNSARNHGREHKQAECILEADRAIRRIEFESQRDNTSL
ncbi:hypothetical protein G6F70_002583 [Rhizopus microsporus]|nr:hypothetical protein G6F71_005471 [Rhizopus microsporus]KAG1202093.1 hypothetical protein G6F70_002583 [Rhizopus microsporus]KAG1210310.1 hypothetical protein G6F69_005600 [Rhizopus microsporus]KAG1232064.1 hypothetical protein G6F67_005298 [Rhizopus microsporus]KAG1264281.1 hypothetical protein G6F68_004484 [Rhizopus microsporus]